MQHRNVLSLLHRLLGLAALVISTSASADSLAGFPLLSLFVPTVSEAAMPRPEDALTTQEIRTAPQPASTIDLTSPSDNLWDRIRNGFAMTNLNDDLVLHYQQWYQNRPDALRRMVERSRPYLHHIVEELEARGMPTELALLPMVESSFNPMAYSRSHAAGLWQFIPATGKRFNLEQSWWQDQRRDIVASTTAALDYLQTIYEMHGDWHLALASYNWGEHAVARAIAKNQAKGLPTDYQSLTMPGETRYYVPKLQAIKNIVAQPELFGLNLDPIPNKAYFGTVSLDETVDIATAARLAETPIDEFIALNPAYHRPVIPGESTSPIVIPVEKMDTFLANLARYEAQDKPLSSWRTYQLKKGEKLEAVAARFGLTVARLKQISGITPRMKIGPGQNFLVPTGSAANIDAVAAHLPKTPGDPPRAAKPGKGSKAQQKAGRGSPQKKAVPQARGAAKQPATKAVSKSAPKAASKSAPKAPPKPAPKSGQRKPAPSQPQKKTR